jgi:protein SCO1/2
LILYCYHYDPTTGKYGPAIMNIMRAAGVLTLAGLAALIVILRRRQPRAEAAVPTGAGAGGAA